MNYLKWVPPHYASFCGSPFFLCSVKGTPLSNLSVAKFTSGPTLCSSRLTSESVGYTTHPRHKLCNSHSDPTEKDENTIFSWHYLSLSSGRHRSFQPLVTTMGLSPTYTFIILISMGDIICRMKAKSIFNKR